MHEMDGPRRSSRAHRRRGDRGRHALGTGDHVIPPGDQLAMAHNAGSHLTEIDAPRLSMIADPRAVTSVIEQAANRTR